MDWKLARQNYEEARQTWLDNIHVTKEEVISERSPGEYREYIMFDSPKTYMKEKIYIPEYLTSVKRYRAHVLNLWSE